MPEQQVITGMCPCSRSSNQEKVTGENKMSNHHEQQVHTIRQRFNDVLCTIARYTEMLLAVVILVVIALAGMRLVFEVFGTNIGKMDSTFFSEFLAEALALVVGVEFVKMLCQHSTKTVLEVLMFATARQMVVEHMGTFETLIGVAAIAVLFAARKFLMTADDDMDQDRNESTHENTHNNTHESMTDAS